jgi:IPT/TIG domain-containing protein
MTAGNKSLLAGAFAVILCGCLNPSAYTPVITDVRASGNALGFVFTGETKATVLGQYFSPGVTVYWNGTAVPTTYQSGTSLEIALGPAQTSVAGTFELTAANDGGLLSDPFRVGVVNAQLDATSLDPPQAAVGSGALIVSVIGAGFRPDSQVLLNGSSVTSTFVSSTKLSFVVPASLLSVAGEALVQVANQNCAPNPSFNCTDLSPAIPFLNGPSTKTRVEMRVNDMAWDATHANLYVTSASTVTFGGPATIAGLDPATGTFGPTTSVPSGPVQLSVSAQDAYLYVAVQNGAGVPATRLSLPALTNPTPVPSNSTVELIAAVPGAPTTAAFVGFSGVGVFDDTAVRGNLANVAAITTLMWGVDSSTLFGVDSAALRLLSFQVGPNGVSLPTILRTIGYGSNIRYDRTARLLYDTAGNVFDEQGNAQSGFAMPPASCRAMMDGGGGRMFFACADAKVGLTLRSFDVTTRLPLSRVLLEVASSSQSPFAVAFVRFASNGLAVASSSGWIHLYTGAFVH